MSKSISASLSSGALSTSRHPREALEAIYRITMRADLGLKEICDRVTESLAEILQAPFVVIRCPNKQGEISTISCYAERELSYNPLFCPRACGPCGDVYAGEKPVFLQSLSHHTNPPCVRDARYRAFLGVPIQRNDGEMIGVLAAMHSDAESFRPSMLPLMEIFAQYIAREIEHEQMEAELRKSEQTRVIGQITAGVAHEVRNPLNSILMNTELLESTLPEEGKCRDFVARIRRQADRLETLMSDLLELRKPVKACDVREYDFSAVCGEVAENWRQAGNKNALLVELPESSLRVRFDRERFTQVIVNLLDNAAQHSSSDAPIRLAVADTDGKVRLRVVDRGTGIDEEMIPFLRDPFYTTRKGGSGLGLSIVHHIARAHGGELLIRNNEPPPGATFEVRLPFAEKETAPEIPQAVSEGALT